MFYFENCQGHPVLFLSHPVLLFGRSKERSGKVTYFVTPKYFILRVVQSVRFYFVLGLTILLFPPLLQSLVLHFRFLPNPLPLKHSLWFSSNISWRHSGYLSTKQLQCEYCAKNIKLLDIHRTILRTVFQTSEVDKNTTNIV